MKDEVQVKIYANVDDSNDIIIQIKTHKVNNFVHARPAAWEYTYATSERFHDISANKDWDSETWNKRMRAYMLAIKK